MLPLSMKWYDPDMDSQAERANAERTPFERFVAAIFSVPKSAVHEAESQRTKRILGSLSRTRKAKIEPNEGRCAKEKQRGSNTADKPAQ